MDTTQPTSPPLKKINIQRPKGTQDIRPQDAPRWQHVEATARRLMALANYHEVRTPIFESTELFERGVGESTDIVNKEMYTFLKGERSLTLRPENTAGVVRAYVENGMSRLPKPVKLYYIGPMFRYERPQAGRQRQFHQLGIEQFGLDTPASDAETLQLAMNLFQTLGLPGLSLEINNIGCPACRDAFKERLKALVKPQLETLCESCQNRYVVNPLRMLDCKEETCKTVYAGGDIGAFLEEDTSCEACQTHFSELKTLLNGLSIPFSQNKRLVRGLDYYTRTVFEITSNHLGAQNAVCGGGRYNNLVETFGGPPTPAVGWGVGLERLISLLPEHPLPTLSYFIVSQHPLEALRLCQQIRDKGHAADLDLSGKAFGKQFALADKLQATTAVVLGETEIQNQQVTLKNLKSAEQTTLSQAEFLAQL